MAAVTEHAGSGDPVPALLLAMSTCAAECARCVVACCERKRGALSEAAGLARMQCEALAAEIYSQLERAHGNVLARSDAFTLATDIRDLVDTLHALAHRLTCDVGPRPPTGAQQLATMLQDGCRQLVESLARMAAGDRPAVVALHEVHDSVEDVARLRCAQLDEVPEPPQLRAEQKEIVEALRHAGSLLESVAVTLEVVTERGHTPQPPLQWSLRRILDT